MIYVASTFRLWPRIIFYFAVVVTSNRTSFSRTLRTSRVFADRRLSLFRKIISLVLSHFSAVSYAREPTAESTILIESSLTFAFSSEGDAVSYVRESHIEFSIGTKSFAVRGDFYTLVKN